MSSSTDPHFESDVEDDGFKNPWQEEADHHMAKICAEARQLLLLQDMMVKKAAPAGYDHDPMAQNPDRLQFDRVPKPALTRPPGNFTTATPASSPAAAWCVPVYYCPQAMLPGEQFFLAHWPGAPQEFPPAPQCTVNEEASPPLVKIPSGQPLPSRGAALHNDGRCSPCAFTLQPGGCSNGEDCEFCHVRGCDKPKLKRLRRAKTNNLRALGIPPKVKELVPQKTRPALPPARRCDATMPVNSAEATSLGQSSAVPPRHRTGSAQDMNLGESKVTYEGQRASVKCLVDMIHKGFPDKQRVLVLSFNLTIRNCQVPFSISIKPWDELLKLSTEPMRVKLQIRCKAETLPPGFLYPLNISLGIGAQQFVTSHAHDFTEKSVFELASHVDVESPSQCLVEAEFAPAPEVENADE